MQTRQCSDNDVTKESSCASVTNKFHSGKLCSAPPTKFFPYADECKLLLIHTLKVVHFPLSIVHLERSCGGNLIFSDVTFIKSSYKVIFSVAHTSKATRRFISQSQESTGFKRIDTFSFKQQTQLALIGPRLN